MYQYVPDDFKSRSDNFNRFSSTRSINTNVISISNYSEDAGCQAYEHWLRKDYGNEALIGKHRFRI